MLAEVYALHGDQTRARAYADSARIDFEAQLRASPNDAQLHALRGLVLAYLGRKDEAIREGLRGVELNPVSKDGFGGPYIQLQLVRIYLLVGEPEKALDQLEPLLKIPYHLSPGWLRIDPDVRSGAEEPAVREAGRAVVGARGARSTGSRALCKYGGGSSGRERGAAAGSLSAFFRTGRSHRHTSTAATKGAAGPRPLQRMPAW